MDVKELTQHVDRRFDAVEGQLREVSKKLDDQLTRVAKAEADIGWIKSAGRNLTIVTLGVVGKLAHLTFWK